MASVSHIVMFKYNKDVSQTEKHLIASRFLALADTCQIDERPYLVSVTGGSNNSPEGATKGYDHAFVVTFANPEERDYYVHSCPTHDAYKKTLKGKLEDVCVFDFSGGVF